MATTETQNPNEKKKLRNKKCNVFERHFNKTNKRNKYLTNNID